MGENTYLGDNIRAFELGTDLFYQTYPELVVSTAVNISHGGTVSTYVVLDVSELEGVEARYVNLAEAAFDCQNPDVRATEFGMFRKLQNNFIGVIGLSNHDNIVKELDWRRFNQNGRQQDSV